MRHLGGEVEVTNLERADTIDPVLVSVNVSAEDLVEIDYAYVDR
jgi:hypothetical protein